MSVITYSRSADGSRQISPHFRVEEFACKDGSDAVLISQELVQMLEKLRDKLGCSINVNSGYRTVSHNRAIGGSLTSKHCHGLAADVICKREGKTVSAKEVCCAAQSLNFPGIAYITAGATHLDVRDGKWWADESRHDKKVTDFYQYFGMENPDKCPHRKPASAVKMGSRGDGVKWVQWHLEKRGFSVGSSGIDGCCGPATVSAIISFQKSAGLDPDGVCGPATRKALET